MKPNFFFFFHFSSFLVIFSFFHFFQLFFSFFHFSFFDFFIFFIFLLFFFILLFLLSISFSFSFLGSSKSVFFDLNQSIASRFHVIFFFLKKKTFLEPSSGVPLWLPLFFFFLFFLLSL